MPIHKLLVPLDGSPVSESALPFAEAIAHRAQATIALVRAVHTQSLPVIEHAERYLEALGEQLASRGLTIETGVPFGNAADWIVEEEALRKVDLVVMATHDRTGPERWLRGSIAEAVISRGSTPVLVVRAADGMRPVERLQHPRPVFVVPLDGSELAEAALPLATQLAAALNGTLVLVSVVPRRGQIVYAEGVMVPHTEVVAQRMLLDAQTYQNGVSCAAALARTVRLGDPATEIAAEADERGAAAVVMATHGRTGVMRSLLGSIAGQVVHTGAMPVLLVRPPKLRAAEIPVARSTAAATGAV